MIVGRNDPCPCGSGRKYKACHGSLGPAQPATPDLATLLQQARTAYQRRDAASASACCRAVLALDPDNADAWHLTGVIDLQRGDYPSASISLARAVAGNPARAELHRDLARAQIGAGFPQDSAASARRATELDPADSDGWNVLGMSLESTDPALAFTAWKRAAALAPDQPEAHFRIGDLHRRNGDFHMAVDAYRKALSHAPDHAVLHNNLALALQAQDSFDEAEKHYRAAIRQQPGLVEALANLGDLLHRCDRVNEAIQWFREALAQRPDLAAIWAKLGTCQHRHGDIAGAKASFERALALHPDDPANMINAASLLLAQNAFAEAQALIARALAIRPDFAEAQGMSMYAKQQTCEWEGLDRLVEQQRARLQDPKAPAVVPHNLLALPFTPAELLTASRKWVSQRIRPRPAIRSFPPQRDDGRLRIGYLGSDFRMHPLANLLTEVIEVHDRTRFEVFCYSFGPDDGSVARARWQRAFDHFIDVREESAAQTAQRIRDDAIAILFDTSGYALYARSEIFALRPAPIQINCIGFPASLGADYIDYILTDAFVTPPEQQVNFSERFMLLPNCYLPCDTRRAVAPTPTRAECGLPAQGFVFCCFNASYKILPETFDVWMRLLADVPGSVLWLLETNPPATRNLRREAGARDISPDRIVFAPRVPLPEHMARHAVADLFLDTFPCNAHTTTNDALLAGLPLLTCAGDTFASRVSGSHLHAIGLPELVTESLAEYETRARELARNPSILAGIRMRLVANRHRSPLFDTVGYTRALEDRLLRAWQAYASSMEVTP